MSSTVASETARERVAAHDLWYHTMELAPGVVTPGWFDLRPIVERMPWPEVRGRRCLDVGPYDGFLSFELERRGAAEVVAADIGSHPDWDWPVRDARARARARARSPAPRSAPGSGSPASCSAPRSSASRSRPTTSRRSGVGRFDVVVCGSLMLHLRDPVRALEAIRGVCDGHLLSAETIRLGLTAMHPREPAAELVGTGELCQWWVPNAAGHRRMLDSAGFEIVKAARPYAVPFGPGHPPRGRAGGLGDPLLGRLVPGWPGVPHSAALARPTLRLVTEACSRGGAPAGRRARLVPHARARPGPRHRGLVRPAPDRRRVRAAGADGRDARARRRHLGRLLGVRDGAPRRRGRRARPRRRARARLAAAAPPEASSRTSRAAAGFRLAHEILGSKVERVVALRLRRDPGGARHLRPRLLRLGPDPPARPAARARADRRALHRAPSSPPRSTTRGAGSSRSRSPATAPTARRRSSSGSRRRRPGGGCCGPRASTTSASTAASGCTRATGFSVRHVVHHATKR